MSESLVVTAYIGLGSNLADPQARLRCAFTELAQLPQSQLLAQSSLYRSAPLGPQDQPDYLNAVAALETALSPLALLAGLQAVETAQQRVRGERWGPRTLDLDLLLYADRTIDLPTLTVPHRGLYERNFVLYPLAEIAPGLVIPGVGVLDELLARCERGSLVVIEKASRIRTD
ncbi:MAG TPA: 2-amino-4-hydroxy-6-hydroxymethyldihydropteridine diphosphokinase [Gammaproteobacteria bacterium]|nr:2-amino-4-hydroxy-6-hydroxymethyldihydropteridine diphosphokinase [Gammaproteobacteria bacterium]